jgi:uncharacterized SAM-binding protein YcdF (DUF218 family)
MDRKQQQWRHQLRRSQTLGLRVLLLLLKQSLVVAVVGLRQVGIRELARQEQASLRPSAAGNLILAVVVLGQLRQNGRRPQGELEVGRKAKWLL